MTDYAKGFVAGVASVVAVWLLLSVAYVAGQSVVRARAVEAGVAVQTDDGFKFKKVPE